MAENNEVTKSRHARARERAERGQQQACKRAVSLHGLGDLLLQIEALEKQRLRVVMSMYACKMIVMVMVIVRVIMVIVNDKTF